MDSRAEIKWYNCFRIEIKDGDNYKVITRPMQSDINEVLKTADNYEQVRFWTRTEEVCTIKDGKTYWQVI